MDDSRLDIKAFLDKDEQKDLLRFLTAGSVDDGKSTLIGRLLFDSKKLYEDQLDALERDSKRMGNAGDHIDYALLLDGLRRSVSRVLLSTWPIATSPRITVNSSLPTLRDTNSIRVT